MAHHEVELPRHISRGAKGGSKFNTTVLMLASGLEQRNINWSRVRGEWDVGYGIQDRGDMEDVLAFFHARWGKAHSFNFYDWIDHSVPSQIIGIGDGVTTTYQLFKRYQMAGDNYYYDYTIKKVINGSDLGCMVDNAGDNIFVPYSTYSIDNTTGILTTNTVLSAGTQLMTLGFEFYRPVRFDTDMMDVQVDYHEQFTIPQVPLVEVKL